MVRDRIEALSHHLSSPTPTKMSTPARVFQLIPGVQSYDWGIPGSKAPRVAQFAAATKQLNFTADDDKPYAELWMGTHPSMPSRIISSESSASGEFTPLAEYLAQHPELIGERVRAKFSDDEPGALPFLFKVLSVGKALSIQAHPDKTLGKKLHAQRPDVYKDPNHKPEMAIALTAFRGFCGFRPLAEIVAYIKNIPELAKLVQLDDDELARAASLASSPPERDEVKQMLKTIFGNLMNAPKSTYEPLAQSLSDRFACGKVDSVDEVERKLVVKLAEEFPRDVGIFCTFLLNVSSLQPGEALFLQANEPHAYLEGEILECMAASDNVVRAGLTPKLRDTDTLISMCTYQSGSNRGRLNPTQWAKSITKKGTAEAWLYDPPIAEFSVVTTTLAQQAQVEEAQVDGPSILLVLEGKVEIEAEEGVRVGKGQVVFVAAGTAVTVQNTGEGEARLARAFVET
ncbi:mannose-6-phosphate isomerase [Moesziomyces antarcticus]|uniref:Mannose-6-phosphate isomerase n=2 Tax=Pseudozyma antarctica TaxID=84753 RepID=A0A081CLR8_PSEA2|nr:mannose-6-phosphate isomerase [Moesziomyces antarcticus]GAK67614.1 mannose-6-phosphate isomerase [Moesziomyces antarcticus]